ncbi:DUF948 domain-containing protein [Oceanobacillus massiliensis]|uniref:DUF948 domain-containing protein n=1 Tax=Oceanobacillus massiliensis TaxID=1465765 RepID=UPI000287B6B4|nr:DUF948 domain-containing protein [Oceanobacillus massiliensis]
MIWIGIGLIIIGIGFIGLVVFLIKPLNNLAAVFRSLQKTTDELPKTVEDITSQTTKALGTGVETLHQVNSQVKELSPVFHIVGDAGRTTNQLSSSMVNAVDDMKVSTQNANEFTSRKNLKGLYGALTLGYFLFQKSKEMKKEQNTVSMH